MSRNASVTRFEGCFGKENTQGAEVMGKPGSSSGVFESDINQVPCQRDPKRNPSVPAGFGLLRCHSLQYSDTRWTNPSEAFVVSDKQSEPQEPPTRWHASSTGF